MSDNFEQNSPTSPPPGTEATTDRVGFCQDCGRPLTRETLRAVGSGIFCEPCLGARVNATAAAPQTGTPHPFLAGLLSIIPGVGTIYNGQYAKGIAHLLIFVVLSSLGDHVKIFGLVAFVWWCYQIIDAYQTAKARLEGRPLPNPFGLNDIGERMGFGKNWGNATPSAYAPVPPATPAAGPVAQGPGWVGYVPPANFAAAVPPQPTVQSATQGATAWGHVPYAPTYAPAPSEVPYTAMPPYAEPLPVTVLQPASRFPVGALVLILLGVLFLLGELAQQWDWTWRLNANWLFSAIFAGLAAWIFSRRLRLGLRLISCLRWPVVLAVLAVLFALQALDSDLGLWRTWPVLFIVFGGLLIVERAFPTPLPVAPPFVPADAEAEAERRRAAWSTTNPNPTNPSPANPDDTTKGGL